MITVPSIPHLDLKPGYSAVKRSFRKPPAGTFSTVSAGANIFTISFGRIVPYASRIFITPRSVLAAVPFYVTNNTGTTADVVFLSPPLVGLVEFDWFVQL